MPSQITDHASLKTAVQSYLNRTDVNLDLVIESAEDQLRLDDRVRHLTEVRYAIIEDGQAVPPAFQEPDSWYYEGDGGRYGEIDLVEPGELGGLLGRYGPVGAPQFAARVGGVFRFAPRPGSGASRATGALTFAAQPAPADTVTIGGRTYTFQTTLSDAGDVRIGTTLGATIANLVAAVNGSDGGGPGTYHTDTARHTEVYAEADDGLVRVTAEEPGDEGNLIATSTSSVNASWGGAALAGGSSAGSEYMTRMTFWQGLPDLADGPNWLIQDHPSIYLYATLLECQPWLKHDERIPVFEGRLERLLFNLGIEVEDERFGGDLTRRPGYVIGG